MKRYSAIAGVTCLVALVVGSTVPAQAADQLRVTPSASSISAEPSYQYIKWKPYVFYSAREPGKLLLGVNGSQTNIAPGTRFTFKTWDRNGKPLDTQGGVRSNGTLYLDGDFTTFGQMGNQAWYGDLLHFALTTPEGNMFYSFVTVPMPWVGTMRTAPKTHATVNKQLRIQPFEVQDAALGSQLYLTITDAATGRTYETSAELGTDWTFPAADIDLGTGAYHRGTFELYIAGPGALIGERTLISTQPWALQNTPVV